MLQFKSCMVRRVTRCAAVCSSISQSKRLCITNDLHYDPDPQSGPPRIVCWAIFANMYTLHILLTIYNMKFWGDLLDRGDWPHRRPLTRIYYLLPSLHTLRNDDELWSICIRFVSIIIWVVSFRFVRAVYMLNYAFYLICRAKSLVHVPIISAEKIALIFCWFQQKNFCHSHKTEWFNLYMKQYSLSPLVA